uniref:BTB domain-containing protein n=1 Tax=Panagrolaimus davidi TaxID=227884 RepID=A0A914PZG3_9BILA
MVLKKLIKKAHKNAFLSQENEKYFFDVKFKLSNGKFIYANKFFLFSIFPEFQSLINSDEPIDAPTQLFKNGPQTFLEQCYGDCVTWDSDSKSFVQLNEDSEKAKENYEIAAKKRYDLFMAQDKENGYFDVAFKFKDQKVCVLH